MTEINVWLQEITNFAKPKGSSFEKWRNWSGEGLVILGFSLFSKAAVRGKGEAGRKETEAGVSGSSIPLSLEKYNFSQVLYIEVLKTKPTLVTVTVSSQGEVHVPHMATSPIYLPMGFIPQVHLRTL